MVRSAAHSLALALAAAFAACTPTFSDDTSIVSAPRLLAVQATPAEAAPAEELHDDRAVRRTDGTGGRVVDRLGDLPPAEAARRSGPDRARVLRRHVEQPHAARDRGSVAGTVPSDACELFGPESPPPPEPGEPATRPTDPDATGGFYLPVRVKSDGDVWSAALERIACQPSGVAQSVFTAFSDGYVANQNPAIASLARVGDDGGTTAVAPDAPGAGPALTVAAGARLTFRAGWASCPATPAACSGAEAYLYIDPTTKQIATGRESIVASWYAGGGTFDLDRVGRDGTDTTTTVDNGWTAPSAVGPVHLWVVLRDARGGVGWGSYTIAVE